MVCQTSSKFQIAASWHLLNWDDVLFGMLALLFEAAARLVNAAQTTRSLEVV